MSVADAFHFFVACHIATGAVGLLAFWVPVSGPKGGITHARFGKLFTGTMVTTGAFAVCISLMTLIDPLGTHPHLTHHPEFGGEETIRGLFGWMMIYLAVLTVNLAWYGWQCIQFKRRREAQREWRNLLLQAVVFVAAVNCLVQGVKLGQPLMMGISAIGFATVATNLWYLYKPTVGAKDWLLEHIKALVGAGISVYTAFFAFGAVRFLPEAALTPTLWSIPLVVGISLIVIHQHRVRSGKTKPVPRRTPARGAVAGQGALAASSSAPRAIAPRAIASASISPVASPAPAPKDAAPVREPAR